jgi:hypothetical protein
MWSYSGAFHELFNFGMAAFQLHSYQEHFPLLYIVMYYFFCRKDVSLPVQLQKAMAAEAEASREARAKVIAAEGEMKASRALKEAAEVMVDNPIALQVRFIYS